MELKTDRSCHAKYNLQYHLILVTKYRKPCITAEIFETIKNQFIHVADMNNCKIDEISYENDHVHVLLSTPPQICLSALINSLKSTSSRRVRQKHASYLSKYYWKPIFWNRSYLILSSGGAPIEIIRAYIQEQGTEKHAAKGRPKKKAAITT